MCNIELENKLRNLVKLKNWKKIIEIGLSLPIEEKSIYLWVWPTESNLNFLKNVINSNDVHAILSIGCGTGLLEWIIQQSTGIIVNGLEHDKSWWDSVYSVKPFIKLNFTINNMTSEFLKESICRNDWKFALLFCYFNNRKAFNEYIKNYQGNCVIIIGPGNERYTHTDPEPFNPKFPKTEDNEELWILKDFCEINSTKDFIAIYIRK